MVNKRGELSKFDYGECQFRGGYEIGYEQALADIGAALQLAGKHVQELEAWAGDDPAIELDPPVLTLEAAHV